MNRAQEIEKAKEFFADCLFLLDKKAHDYAKDDECFSNFLKVGVVCDVPLEKVFIMFMTVKLARLIELINKPNNNESKHDSMVDIANYACLMALATNYTRRIPKQG